jgi:hypothetical protein
VDGRDGDLRPSLHRLGPCSDHRDLGGFRPGAMVGRSISLLELVAATGVAFWIWGRALYMQFKIKAEVARLGLSSVQGPAELDRHHHPDPRFHWHYLRIVDTTFPATEETARFFDAGRDYRIYFVDFCDRRTVLSAEPLMS